MNKAELIRLLAPLPDDTVITVMRDDFPHDIAGIETLPATRAGEDHWYVEYFPEVHDVQEDGPMIDIVVIR
jgi:hypothetical protein